MNTSQLLDYCMKKTGAEQDLHPHLPATQIKIDDVMFAMVYDDSERPMVALKTSPALAELLRQEHADVFPCQHLNKVFWSTLFLDGELPDSQIYYLIDDSYQQALTLVPEATRQRLGV